MAEETKYNVYDAYKIKDEIKRCVYFNKYIYDNDHSFLGKIDEVDHRIEEYINLHENGTFVDDLDMYCTSLVSLLTVTHFDKDKLKNYNYLYYTALTEISKIGTMEQADITINRFKRNDFEIWYRRKKLLSLMNKLN